MNEQAILRESKNFLNQSEKQVLNYLNSMMRSLISNANSTPYLATTDGAYGNVDFSALRTWLEWEAANDTSDELSLKRLAQQKFKMDPSKSVLDVQVVEQRDQGCEKSTCCMHTSQSTQR